MPVINPEVTQWISQMGDKDQAVAFFAYQSLQEQVLRTGAPGMAEAQATLAAALGEALTAPARRNAGGAQPASLNGNPFLAAVAAQTAAMRHPSRVRVHLARLLGYIPHEAAVPYLAKALEDLEARDMARCSLECHPSERALDVLTGAMDSVGESFRAGVANSLGKRGGPRAAAALRKAADDPQPEVRQAVLEALALIPDPAHDAILEQATRAGSGQESVHAHICRARLAEALRAAGNRDAALRIYRAIQASDAPEAQKAAARLALG
jgi:HEAT repeat protein